MIVLNNAAPGGALVTSPAARSLLVEETASYGKTDGLTALPLAAPATQWYFAPTAARTGGHSYLTVLNPGSAPLTATLAPVGGDSRSGRAFDVAAGAQTVVEPATLLPDSAAAAWLTLRASRPVLVSRVTKLPPAQEPQLARSYVAGLVTTGVAALSRRVAFAAGDTRGAFSGVGETLFLLNPHNQATTVQLTYLTDLGRVITRGLTLGPGLAAMVTTDPAVGTTLHGVLMEASLPIAATMLWQFNAGAYALQDNGASTGRRLTLAAPCNRVTRSGGASFRPCLIAPPVPGRDIPAAWRVAWADCVGCSWCTNATRLYDSDGWVWRIGV